MSRVVANSVWTDAISSTTDTVDIDAANSLSVAKINGYGSDIVVDDNINMGGSKNVTGANLVTTKYLASSATEPLVSNSNFEVSAGLDLKSNSLKATSGGIITCADNLKVASNKILYATTIETADLTPATVLIATGLSTELVETDNIDTNTGDWVNVLCDMKLLDNGSVYTDKLKIKSDTSIVTDRLQCDGLLLQTDSSIQVDYSDGQSLQLINPTNKAIDTTLKALFYDPADNKIKTSTYTTAPTSSKQLVEYFTMNRFETVPYTTITMPTLPSELTDAIRFFVPSDYAYVLDSIPGFSPTESTVYQNAYVHADTGVWKVRGTDLDKIIATTAMPLSSEVGGGLILTLDEVPTYDIHYAIFKPFYMTSDSTSGFRFQCSYAIMNPSQGKTIIALTSATAVAQTPFKCNGADPIAYFDDAMFLVHGVADYGNNNLHFKINKNLGPSSHSTAGWDTGISVVEGRLINLVLDWNPTLGKIRFTITHGASTYDSNSYLSAADCPSAYQYAPFFSQTRKSGQTKGLWLNKVICQQFYA